MGDPASQNMSNEISIEKKKDEDESKVEEYDPFTDPKTGTLWKKNNPERPPPYREDIPLISHRLAELMMSNFKPGQDPVTVQQIINVNPFNPLELIKFFKSKGLQFNEADVKKIVWETGGTRKMTAEERKEIVEQLRLAQEKKQADSDVEKDKKQGKGEKPESACD